MSPVEVTIRLQHIHCFHEGDGPGKAEPYLWNVFFKIDGDTTVVRSLSLQGSATVIGTPGNHGNLTKGGVEAGDNVPIPPEVGTFRTVLKPIPLDPPMSGVQNVSGYIGCISVLLEQDNTPNSAVASGHKALNAAVQSELDRLISTLNLTHPVPTEEDIERIKKNISSKVENAIKDEVGIWDWLRGFGNQDEKIGSAIFRFSQKDVENAGVDGIPLKKRWKKEGDWEITGLIAMDIKRGWLEPVLYIMMD